MYSEKEVNELLEITFELSKELEDLSHIREKGIGSWDKKYDIFNKFENIRRFISFPKVNSILKKIEEIISSGLSKGLENLEYIRKEGIEKWDEGIEKWETKYHVLDYYRISKRFLQSNEVYKMHKKIKSAYKILHGDEWKERLNEKAN